MDNFLFQKQNPTIACSRKQMTQIQKRKKTADQFWKKRLFSKTFFTSVLTTAREMPKTKGKIPDKMYQLVLKIATAKQKQLRKNPLYA